MAIRSCTLDWHGFSGGVSADNVTYRERYMVVFDDQDDPRIRPMMAVDNTTVGPNPIPQGWTGHPYNPWLVVTAVDPEISADGPMVIYVNVTFSNKRLATSFNAPNLFASPIDQPWEIEWFNESVMDYINEDRDGNMIANVLGDVPDPPLQDENVRLGLRIRRAQEIFYYNTISTYVDTVNNANFWGFGADQALCRNITARRMRQGNFFFWDCSYEFLFNPLKWKIRFEHIGYRCYKDISGVKTKVRAQVNPANDGIGPTDTKWDPMPTPVKLDANGYRVSDESNDKYFLESYVKKRTNFGWLALE